MGLFLRSLLIVMIVKSQAGLQVASSGNQETISCEQDIIVDKLKVILSDHLQMVNSEIRNTKYQVEDLKSTMTDTQATVSSELEDTRRKMDELQVAVSGSQETVSSELEDTRRKISELQVAVSALVNLLNNDTSPMESPSATDAFVTTTLGVTYPKDCSDILAIGVSVSGLYMVRPRNPGQAFQVYCDMETDGGGWTVFQRRKDGTEDFYLDFANYSRGFGNLEGEFWLGNDNLHRLTAQGEYELRVDLEGFDSETGYAVYDSFSIANVSDNYRLRVGAYSGTAANGLKSHNYMAFTTKDKDNDVNAIGNCADTYPGGWWFRFCLSSNLNGRYYRYADLSSRGVVWDSFSNYHSLKTAEMKIRSKV